MLFELSVNSQMNEKFSKIILIASSILGVLLIFGVNTHPDVLSTRTIKNLELSVSISSYVYSGDFDFVILEARLEITNMGPLDATLHNANFTISFTNESSVTILIEHTVKLPAGGSFNYTIAPPDLVFRDESWAILEKIKECFFDYTVTLKAHASCGKYKGPIDKSSRGWLVFLHPPPYRLPLLLQHGMFPGIVVNDTFVVSPSPRMLPQSFRVGNIGDIWIKREQYWGLSMRSQEKIRFSFNATEPVHFQLVLSDNPDFNSWGKEKVFIDLSSNSSFSTNFTAPQEGLYILIFQISQPGSVATVILNGVSFWP